MRYIKIYNTSGDVQTALNEEELGKPYMVKVQSEDKIDWNSLSPQTEPVYSAMPLTFEVISGGTISMSIQSPATIQNFEYKLNNGVWTVPSTNPMSFNVNAGDTIQFRGNNLAYAPRSADNISPTVTCNSAVRFKAYGNMMSIIDKDNYESLSALTQMSTFVNFFRRCSGLTDAENLVLQSITIPAGAYYGLFRDCLNLELSPKTLPATTIDSQGYKSLFEADNNLKTAPIVCGTTWGPTAAEGMFYGCTSLSATPELNMVEVSNYGIPFHVTFHGNTSLTRVDNIHFPSTVQNSNIFSGMFQNCTNLSYVKCLTENPNATAFGGWLKSVSPTGTFVKHPNATWPSGQDGIPSGWSVEDAIL